MLKGKKIFISGGNGVIGNELIKKLHNNGAIVFVGDLKPRPNDWPSDILYRQGDLNYITKEELNSFNPEYFFHLAATFERSTETYEFWEENYDHNIRLSNYLMSLLKESEQLKKVIFASSYLIYDPQLYSFKSPVEKAHRLKETDPIYPRNLCGVAKLNHEIELRFLEEFNKDKYQTISARIYRSYGKNSRDIISRWIRSLLNNEPLVVFKKEGRFDFIYAEDIAEGLMRLADNPTTQGIYNLGTDNSRTVDELLTVLKIHFPTLTYKDEESPIDYEGSQANTERLYQVLGWKPQQKLEDAIPKIIEFERNRIKEEVEQDKSAILVTSISRKVGLLKALRKAADKLGDITLIGGDIDKNCIGKYFADEFWEMPSLSKVTTADVLAFCKTNNVKLIVPSRDGELLFWASLKDELKLSGISVMVSDKNAINICLDKLSFYEKLKELNIPAIATEKDINSLESSVNTFVVKEQYGAGSLSIGLNLSKEQAIKHAEKLTYPIFQPYISGREFSIDLYIDNNGKVRGVIPRSRDLIVNGESQITTTLNHPKLEKLSAELAESLQLTGHIVLQAMIDENEKIHFIECNSRFGGASTLSLNCGLDSFYWALLEALGANITEYPFIRPKKNKTQVRFPNDIIID